MKFVWEHNGNDTLLYSVDCVGAYTRGESLDVAISKVKTEMESYSLWKNQKWEQDFEIEIVQEKIVSYHLLKTSQAAIADK